MNTPETKINVFNNLFLFYAHWCFACMYGVYVCVSVPDPQEVELQTGVNCHVVTES